MSESYIIEVHDEAAGIVVRDRGGFRFFSSDSDFAALDGSLFRDPRAAELAARHHLEGDRSAMSLKARLMSRASRSTKS